MQIRDFEIKNVKFPNKTTIFQRDITCLNRIQVNLKLYKKQKRQKKKLAEKHFESQGL